MTSPLLSLADGAPVLIPPEPPTDPQPTVKVRPCLGCGSLPHGGVGAGQACLEREIVRLRAELKKGGGV